MFIPVCFTCFQLFPQGVKRTGWVVRGVKDPESVAGHMYRMAIMSFLVDPQSGLDKDRYNPKFMCSLLSYSLSIDAFIHEDTVIFEGDLCPFPVHSSWMLKKNTIIFRYPFLFKGSYMLST